MSSFYGLEIAKTGLFVSQKALNLTGHNIANVQTAGYTRQRLVNESIEPASTKTLLAPLGKGRVGGGVEVMVLEQIRNSFVDREIRSEAANYGMLESKYETLMSIETLFDESNTSSLSSTLADFFNAVQDLSHDGASVALRTNLRQNAMKFTDTANHYYRQLEEKQKVENATMKELTTQINDIATSIADYNEQIFVYELGSDPANDLRDKRNLLLDELSQLVDITYSEDMYNRLTVKIGGMELVDHTKTYKLEAKAEGTCPITGLEGLYNIYIDAGFNQQTLLNYSSGKLEACRRMRDGSTAEDIGIPRMIDNLNKLVRTMAEEFNKIHVRGYGLPVPPATEGATGMNFFDVPGGDYTQLTAKNLRLSDEILDNPRNIAASSTPIDNDEDSEHKGDQNIMLELAALTTSNEVPDVGNFEEFLSDLVVEVSVEVAHVRKLFESQEIVTRNLLQRRESISGVSLDEEITQMISYQHMYSASSRVINAVDEALDVLINRTGLVGR